MQLQRYNRWIRIDAYAQIFTHICTRTHSETHTVTHTQTHANTYHTHTRYTDTHIPFLPPFLCTRTSYLSLLSFTLSSPLSPSYSYHSMATWFICTCACVWGRINPSHTFFYHHYRSESTYHDIRQVSPIVPCVRLLSQVWRVRSRSILNRCVRSVIVYVKCKYVCVCVCVCWLGVRECVCACVVFNRSLTMLRNHWLSY